MYTSSCFKARARFLDGVDVVVRRRGDQAHARRGVPRLRDAALHLPGAEAALHRCVQTNGVQDVYTIYIYILTIYITYITNIYMLTIYIHITYTNKIYMLTIYI